MTYTAGKVSHLVHLAVNTATVDQIIVQSVICPPLAYHVANRHEPAFVAVADPSTVATELAAKARGQTQTLTC